MTTPSPASTRSQASYAVNFVVITAAVFMTNLDLWIANIAIPTIGVSLHQTSLANLSWVLDAYAIVLAALLIIAGRFGDRIGHLKLFLGGIFVFTVGSLLCAFAPSFSFLITGRVVQAVGAAAQLPASLALLMAAAPEQRRHEAGRMWAAVGAMAAAMGPVIGGILVEASWRWVFLINIPIGLVTLIAGARVLPRPLAKANEPRPDALGAALLTISIAALTGALVQAPHWGWSADRTLGLFATFLVTGLVFGVRCRIHPVPLIEGAIIRNRLFLTANLANLIFNTAFGIFLLSVTIWCQNVWHYSALKSGFAVAPGPLMVPIVAVLTIPLVRALGVRQVCVIGALIFAASAIWIVSTETPHPGYVRSLLPTLILAGFGFALTATTLMGTAAAALPPSRAATGSAVVNAGRQVASNFGVAILVTVIGAQFLSSQLEHQINISWRIAGALALASALACLWLPGRNPTPTPAT
jgi:EmrB/QacA subfamily drug resistance transporter